MLEHIGYPSAVINLTLEERRHRERRHDLHRRHNRHYRQLGQPRPPIGHAGLFADTEIKNGRINVIIQTACPITSSPAACAISTPGRISPTRYMYPYYGNRTTAPNPPPPSASAWSSWAWAGSQRPQVQQHHFSERPALFDCVGYRIIYEQIGLNPRRQLRVRRGWPAHPLGTVRGDQPTPRPRRDQAAQ